MLVVDSIGYSGGLALLWKDEVRIEIQNHSHRYINAIVKPSNLSPWMFTGFYGHPDTQKRCKTLGLLRHLKSMAHGPWLCTSDFNEILVSSEKVKGRRRAQYLMENFKNTLD